MEKTLKILTWGSVIGSILMLLRIITVFNNMVTTVKYTEGLSWLVYQIPGILICIAILVLLIIIARFMKEVRNETNKERMQTNYEKLIYYFSIYIILNVVSSFVGILPNILNIVL